MVPTLGNRRDWLAIAVESICHQSAQCNVVVVAPPGADVADIARFYECALIRLGEKGLSVAVNAAWQSLPDECEFVSWLGDDDLLAPGAIAAAEAALDRAPTKAFVYGRTRYIDSQGDTHYVSRPSRLAAGYLSYGKNFVPQQGSLIRRRAIESAGLLDRNLKNAMDQELFTRLHRLHGSVYIPVELSAYRFHDTNITVTKGDLDESQIVRDRYAGGARKLFMRSGLHRRLSHGYYAVQKRLPCSSPVSVGGCPYPKLLSQWADQQVSAT